ncbi:MAG TPA: nucleotide exchange factor GrpE, partial [Rhodobacter sp.]|nr:nucleotide exchange factor GrpE [Rhodobacter sp.]
MAQDQVDQTDLEPQIADTPQDAAQLSDAASQELSMEEALEAVRAERDDMRDRFMRALADAENSRKRSERDRREAEQYGGSKLARDL